MWMEPRGECEHDSLATAAQQRSCTMKSSRSAGPFGNWVTSTETQEMEVGGPDADRRDCEMKAPISARSKSWGRVG